MLNKPIAKFFKQNSQFSLQGKKENMIALVTREKPDKNWRETGKGTSRLFYIPELMVETDDGFNV